MTTVDIHSHVMLPQTFGKAGKYGPDVFVKDGYMVIRVGEHDSRVKLDAARLERGTTDPTSLLAEFAGSSDARVARMDSDGLDIMGVTISPLFYMYWFDADIMVDFCRLQNDALAEYCAPHPDRLFFMPTLPLQDVDAALVEIDRTIGTMGGRAINMGGGNIAGREVDDEALWPIYAKAVEYDVPLFVHPYPEPLAGDGRDDYNLSWILGYLHQETTAFTRLIFGGVLDEFPALKVCLPHGGGFVPYQLGRIGVFSEYMPGVRSKRPVEDYLHNFYFDALVHGVKARRFLVDIVGADNIVWGSNYGSTQDHAGLEFLDDIGLTDAEKAKIKGQNAVKLFHLDRR